MSSIYLSIYPIKTHYVHWLKCSSLLSMNHKELWKPILHPWTSDFYVKCPICNHASKDSSGHGHLLAPPPVAGY